MNEHSTLSLLSLDQLSCAAECLKIMAHPTRLRMVEILMQGSFPVNEIASLCEIPPPQACEHLRLLKGFGLLDSERKGREVYYRIKSPRLPKLLAFVRDNCHDE